MATIDRLSMTALALLLVTAPAQAQPPAPTEALQGFGVVLVIGDVQDAATSDNVPPAAKSALSDLKDFLPYRSYRVLDTAWVLASSSTRQAVTSRLQGTDEQDYEVTLDRVPVGPSTLQVKFTMREPDGNAENRNSDRQRLLNMQLQMFVMQLRRAEESQNQSEIDLSRRRVAEIEATLDTLKKEGRYVTGGATLIDTSFNMSLGETVVVGTSRMRGGNKALIVLVTAVSRSVKPRP